MQLTASQRGRLGAAVKKAQACEAATQPRCRCACGGLAHGAAHGVEIRRAIVAAELELDLAKPADRALLESIPWVREAVEAAAQLPLL